MSLFKKTWVIPTASTIPLLACAFAFSLGPSPRKHLATFYETEQTAQQAQQVLVEAGEPLLPLLVEQLERKKMLRRGLAMQHLAAEKYQPAVPVLERIVKSESEESTVRSEALTALSILAPQKAMKLARHLKGRADLLGTEAKKLIRQQG